MFSITFVWIKNAIYHGRYLKKFIYVKIILVDDVSCSQISSTVYNVVHSTENINLLFIFRMSKHETRNAKYKLDFNFFQQQNTHPIPGS